jgi:hypothetical protein
MNDEIILSKDIKQICYETVYLESSKKLPAISKNIVNFFCKYVVGSKNMYLYSFIATKLQQLEKKHLENNSHMYRKLLVEIYVILSICNKPVLSKPKFKKMTEVEAELLLMKELNTSRNLKKMLDCVNALIKTKIEILWKVSLSLSKNIDYIRNLYFLYSISPKKELILEAYTSLTEDNYFWDTSTYSNIIFQCMLKVNYIYEEFDKYDKNMELYIKCMYCPVYKDDIINYKHKCLESYIQKDPSPKCISIEPKPAHEVMLFEKVL